MAVYYVKNGGNDNASGYSDADALETLYELTYGRTFASGDVICFKRGDTFGTGETQGYFGLNQNNLKLTDYGNSELARPIISGDETRLAFINAYGYQRSGYILENLQFVSGNLYDYNGGNEIGRESTTFLTEGDNFTMTNCLVDGGSSYYCSNVKGDNITIIGSTFQNAKVRHGLYFTFSSNVLVDSCSFLNNNNYDQGESSWEASGLKMKGLGAWAINVGVIKNCWFENNHFGLRGVESKDLDIHNNVFISPSSTGANAIQLAMSSGAGPYPPTNVRFYNNTIIQKISSVQVLAIYLEAGVGIGNNVDIRNNIIYVEGFGAGTEYFIQLKSDYYTNLTINNNLWYSPDSATRWWDINGNGSPYTWANWTSQGYDANSVNADPLFVDYGSDNFSLTSSSNAINIGTTAIADTDIVGNPVPSGGDCDAGAYEYLFTYYVDYTNGDDSWDGLTENTAWKTWRHFSHSGTHVVAFDPGDQILFKRGETWKRSDFIALYPTYDTDYYKWGTWRPSTSALNGVTFGAYGTKTGTGITENRPVIDCDNPDLIGVACMWMGWNGAITGTRWQDIEFTNSIIKTNAGYLVNGHEASSHLTFYNCFFDARNMQGTGYGSTITNETFSFDGDYVTTDSCFFLGELPYNRHAAYTSGNYCIIQNNWAKGFGVSGYKFNGNNSYKSIMRWNIAIDCNVNYMLGETRNCDVYGNISIFTSNADGAGGHVRLEENDDDGVIGPRGNKIYNNTFIGNGAMTGDTLYMIRYRKSGYYSPTQIYNAWATYQDNDIQNNIFYLYNESSDYMALITEGVQHPVPSKYNIYYSDGSFRWRISDPTRDYTSLTSWKTVTNAPANFEQYSQTTSTNNIFSLTPAADTENPAAFIISPNGIAFNTGNGNLTLNNDVEITDFYGNTFNTNDIGAIAYSETVTTTYYIDGTDGNDTTGDGSIGNPWKTYHNVNHDSGSALLNTGDTIYLKSGTTISRTNQANETGAGGSTGKYHWAWKAVKGVTVTTYGGSSPATIDGVGCDAIQLGIVKIIDENGTLLWDHGYSTNVGDCDDNSFINVRFYSSADIPWVDNNGYMVSARTFRPSNNTLFQDCIFDSTEMLGRDEDNEGFTWSGNNCIVERCTFTGNRENRSGIYFGGSDNIVRENIVKYFYATGIKAKGDRNSFYRNLIVDCGTGILLGYPNDTLNNVYSNIIIFTSNATGYLIAIEYTDNSDGIGVQNSVIANNTIIINGYAADVTANNTPIGLNVAYSAGNNQYKNNIVYVYDFYGSGYRTKHFAYYYIGTPLIDSDYNLFWTKNTLDGSSRSYQYAVAGNYYTSLALYKPVVTPSDANSIEADPVFSNHVDDVETVIGYSLSPGSNAIDAGTTVVLNNSEALVDYYGNEFVTNDIGAIAYSSTANIILYNFQINNSTPSRVYFESYKILDSGTTVTGFTVYGKTISSVTINSGYTTGHYFTLSADLTWWDNILIDYVGGSNIQDSTGNNIVPFTLTYIENYITEPTAATVRYITTTGAGSHDGTSEGNAWTLGEASGSATSGMTIYIKAGLYTVPGTLQSDGFVPSNSGTVSSPIKLIGYKTTPGDITGNILDTFTYPDISTANSYIDSTEYPLFQGNNQGDWHTSYPTRTHRGIQINKDYWIIKNIQIQDFYYNILAQNSHYVHFENMTLANANFVSENGCCGILVGNNANTTSDNNTRVYKCLSFDNNLANFNIRGDYSMLKDCKSYSGLNISYERDNDYGLTMLSARYMIMIGNYAYRFPSIYHGGHGPMLRRCQYSLGYDNESWNAKYDNLCVTDDIDDGGHHNVFKRNRIYYDLVTPIREGCSARDGASYNIWEYNILDGVDHPISLGMTNDAGHSATIAASYNIFRNNIFKNNGTGVIRFIDGDDDDTADISNNEIYNNTFIGGEVLFYLSVYNGTSLINNIFKNNIFYGLTSTSYYSYSSGASNIAGMTYTLEKNDFYNCAFTPPNEAGNYDIDPDFIDLGNEDYRLSLTSTIRDLGETIPSIYFDYNLNLRIIGNYSIGAFQYQAGTIYYVDATSGVDTNSGLNQGDAWKTIGKIINNPSIIAGDSVYFKRGETYPLSAGGNSTKFYSSVDNLTIDAYDIGDLPIWDGEGTFKQMIYQYSAIAKSGLTFRNIKFYNPEEGTSGPAYETNIVYMEDCTNTTFENCHFDGNYMAYVVVYLSDAVNLIFRNNIVEKAKIQHGLYIKNGSDNVLIEYNTFRYNGTAAEYAQGTRGLKFNSSTVRMSNPIVRYNTFLDNYSTCFQDSNSDGLEFYYNLLITRLNDANLNSSGIRIDEDAGSVIDSINGKIYNNTIILSNPLNGTTGVRFDSGTGATTTGNGYEIKNNIFYSYAISGSGTAYMYYSVPDNTATYTSENNLFYGNGDDIKWYIGSTTTTYTGLPAWSAGTSKDLNSFESNPLFVDYDTLDFTLQINSVAIDSGVATLSNIDIDGISVPTPAGTNPDIGAYEYWDTTPGVGWLGTICNVLNPSYINGIAMEMITRVNNILSR